MLDARPVAGRFRRLRSWANAVLVAILLRHPVDPHRGRAPGAAGHSRARFHVFGLVIFPQELFFLWLILAAGSWRSRSSSSPRSSAGCGVAGRVHRPSSPTSSPAIARRIQGWKGFRPPRSTWRSGAASPPTRSGSAAGLGDRLSTWSPTSARPTTCSDQAIFTGRASLYSTDLRLPRGLRRGDRLPGLRGRASDLLQVPVPLRALPGRALRPGHPGDRLRHQTTGEPRGKKGQRRTGDCVDCGLCVAVCPTGYRHPRRSCSSSASPAPSASTPVTA